MKALAVLGTALLALTLAALALYEPGALVVAQKNLFVALLAAAAGVYFLAVRTVLTSPPRTIWLILAIAAAMRLAVLFAPPFLSSDVYRYVWDGRVQAAGINPYLHIPADPALASLRDDAVYPRINRASYAPTIYPPAAQAIFAAAAQIAPGVTGMKAVMLGFEALAMLCLWHLGAGARLAIYAWNPLTVWAFAGNGHVDAAAIGLIALALLLRSRLHHGWAGMAIGAAVLVKFLPAAILPALWRRPDWRLPLAVLATIAALYALYAGAGTKLLGFLGGYGAEEGLRDGSGLWLLAGIGRLTPLPAWAAPAYLAAAGAALLALAWRIARRPAHDIAADAGLLAAALTVVISPHYPWYFAWLSLFAALAPSRTLIWLGAAPVLLYVNPGGDQFLWPSLVYLPALALTIAQYRRPT